MFEKAVSFNFYIGELWKSCQKDGSQWAITVVTLAKTERA